MHYLNALFRDNLGLKIISVLIAAFLWAYVMVRENPAVLRGMPARIVLRNVPEDMTVVSYSPQSATVQLSGPRRIVEGLSSAQIVLTADLSGRGAGEHTAALKPSELPQGVTVESLTPATVRVVLDTTVTERHPIEMRLRGKPAKGYTLGTPQPSRTEAQLTGAGSLIARVSRVIAEADVAGLTGTAERPGTVKPLDDKGNPIDGLRVSPSEITVVVPITRGPEQRKTLKVRPQVGEPGEGYEVVSVSARPAEVTLTGGAEELGALESVDTETISIGGLTSKETRKAKLVLPAGVKRVGEGEIEVTVSVGKKQEPGPPAVAPPSPPVPSTDAPALTPRPGGKPGLGTTPAPRPAPPAKPAPKPPPHSAGSAG